ncbi:MAG: amidohydrolase family protein [Rhizobiaceae bacterium]
MTSYLFTGGMLVRPELDELVGGCEVLVEGKYIREVSEKPIRSAHATRIDLGGRTLMPGLIDSHTHAVAHDIDFQRNAIVPSSLAALRAARILETFMSRGFTTIRDLGGADHGLVLATEEGLIRGPRLIICGKALSQTGGHSDFRSRSDDRISIFADRVGAMGRLCDGVDEVRRAAREEIKAGARFVKIMANGGVASPNDPIEALQFSCDEIRTAVEEAGNAGTYVSAHLYTDKAIRRAVECGVYSLEHCNLIRPDTAALAVEAGCIAVPTLIAYEGLAREGEALGLNAESIAKIETVRRGGMESLQIMYDAGLPMAFGTDLLGDLQKYQCLEFEILGRVLPAAEIIRSATTIGARLCGLEGRIGTIAPDAFADLLVVDGDPYSNLDCLAHDGRHMPAIMKDGFFVRNRLPG